ncbi:dicarboxylate/amino acid:cation symporter [Selenomonas sp. KH1T6]|uniref:dicarboxylate/amino acid:cation symporter n=1 Tax=Selenomonas sp. KH1T6 TaxID=3158784 RepID=UPI0008A7E2BF|nr:Na+/H+-dicarboxylate symporter [Selenomonas ruminantium]
MKESMVLSQKDYDKVMECLEKALSAWKLTSNEIMTAQFLLEENFIRLAKASGEEKSFVAEVSLQKRFGNVSLKISSLGEECNPIIELDANSDDEEERMVLASLKSHLPKMSYVRRRGRNIVSILVHESGNKQVWNLGIGLVGGIAMGLILKNFLGAELLGWLELNIFSSIEELFMKALRMSIAPMIFLSVLSGILNMSKAADIGRMGGKLLGISLLKMVIGLAMALPLGVWMGQMPEFVGMVSSGTAEVASQLSLRELLLDIVPGDLVSPFYNNNLLQVLFLAFFFGMLLIKFEEQAEWLKDYINFFNRLMMNAISAILPLMPLVVFASMAKLMLEVEITALLGYFWIILGTVGEIVFLLGVCSIIIPLLGRLSPTPYLKKTLPFGLLPFTTRSSSACLIQTMELCKSKLGMDEKLTLFAIPVGMQFNMTGGGMFVVMLAILLRVTLGLPITGEFLLSFFLASMLLTLTIPSMPGANLMVMASLFEMAGVPAAAVTLFIGIDPIIDSFTTLSAVLSNINSSLILASMEGKVDKGIYSSEE